jgi:hypothetical protein
MSPSSPVRARHGIRTRGPSNFRFDFVELRRQPIEQALSRLGRASSFARHDVLIAALRVGA